MVHRIGKIARILTIAAWGLIVIVCLTLYLIYPNKFTPQELAVALREFQGSIWLGYLAMSAIRGLTLLPSTPLVIAGTLIFPDQLVAVFAVSMVGIVLSSSMVYFFSDHLGLADYFDKRKPELVHKMKAKLEHPQGFVFVALWAFFPFVPTDLVCYLAGTIRINFAKFIAAIFVGESVLCSFYIFFGGAVLSYLR